MVYKSIFSTFVQNINLGQMTESERKQIIALIQREVIPAIGCTEPIAVAYAAAVAVQALGEKPESVEVNVSANIIKNVKSVVVPCTGGLRGIGAAVCAGIVAGCPEKELEILGIAHAGE